MILNYTLGLCVFAALLVGAYSKAVTYQIQSATKVADLSLARLNADAGIELGIFLLSNAPTRHVIGASEQVAFNEGSVRIFIENEAGKIDLNQAPLELVAVGLAAAKVSEGNQREILSQLSRARSRGTQLSSLDDLRELAPADFNIPSSLTRVFTVHSRNRFVAIRYTHEKLRQLLLERKEQFPGWVGTAVSGANTVVAVGLSKDGAQVFKSVLLVPAQKLNSGFSVIDTRLLPGDWITKDDPQA